MSYATLDEATPQVYGVVPPIHKKPVYTADEYLSVVQMVSENKALLESTMHAIGFVHRKSYAGNVILLSRNYVLVSVHCFKEEAGYIGFPCSKKLHHVSVCFDGIRDNISGALDFKILKLTTPITTIVPARLMVTVSIGKSLQLYYRSDLQLLVKEYVSKDHGGHASRSDAGSMVTDYGESGAGRYSLSQRAIHAMHQGNSEALTLNAIVSELTAVKKYQRRNDKWRTAAEILEELDIIDSYMLGLHASTIPITPGAVRAEGPQKKLVAKEGEAFDRPNYLPGDQHVKDTSVALRQSTYASLWGSPGTIALSGTVRVDIQKPTTTHQNIHVQLNGVTGKKTSFATVLLDFQLKNVTNLDQQIYVLNRVAGALKHGVYEGYKHTKFTIKIIDLTWEL